jgi:hypothetical protein
MAMGVVEQSQETVEAYLSVLEETYDSFPINQTTVSVPTAEYRCERERADAGCVDLYTKVENAQSEVLHLRDEGELALPSARTSEADFEYTALDSVEESTGVSCRVDGIEQATILGIHDAESDSEAVYRLAVVFEGIPESGSTNPDAVWQSTVEVPEIIAP